MHKAGLVDTYIREDDNFKFLNKVTEVVAAVFKNFNLGKNYEALSQDYCAIVQCLEMTKTEKRDGDSKDRQKAADTEKLMNSICNVKFVLTLSAITDIIYDISMGNW